MAWAADNPLSLRVRITACVVLSIDMPSSSDSIPKASRLGRAPGSSSAKSVNGKVTK